MPPRRAMILFDGDNFQDMLRSMSKKINVKRLCDLLLGNREAADITFYTSIPQDGPIPPKQSGFIKRLRSQGIRVIALQKRKKQRSNGEEYEVGYPDGLLVERAIRERDYYDDFILVSRDGDFAHLLRILTDCFGKQVELCAIYLNISWDLVNAAQKFWDLSQKDILKNVKSEEPEDSQIEE